MNNLYAVDIETCCDVEDCVGFNVWHKCNHALDPHKGRITQVGVWSPEESHVFKKPGHFHIWWIEEERRAIGQNFKFDLKFLAQVGIDYLDEHWVGDTQLLASLYEPKIPDKWLEEYNAKRDELIKNDKENSYKYRKGSKHSLKTLAPYYLGVEAFWETLGTESEEYVLKDCEYTYRLYEYFVQRLSGFDPFAFYETYMFPAEKFLLGVELRGVKLDLDQLEKDRSAAIKEIKSIERKLKDIWIDAFGKWDELERLKIKDKYEKMLQTALEKKKSKTFLSHAKDTINSNKQLLTKLSR